LVWSVVLLAAPLVAVSVFVLLWKVEFRQDDIKKLGLLGIETYDKPSVKTSRDPYARNGSPLGWTHWRTSLR
jgi:hypothetical protein